MEYWTIPLAIVIGVLGICYLFRNFNFFKRHGVIHVPAIPIFGNMASVVFFRTSFTDFILNLYNEFPGAKYFGFYAITVPTFLLRDPEIIKSVLIKNFNTFPNRIGFEGLNDTIFTRNLFSLKGEKWQYVRNLLSPSFTSSKMKMMFTLMSECATDFAEFLSKVPADKSDMNMKDVFSRYTNDVIATCAFGIKTNSMKDRTNKFFVYGNASIEVTGFRNWKFLFVRSLPRLGKLLDIEIIPRRITGFFKDIIKNTIQLRDAENIKRPDMIQLMMDIRGKGDRRELDIDDMIAQAFVFFFGGFEPTSTAMSFITHEIATNPDVQKKLQREIDDALKESNGEVTYEIINRLEYLNAVINEGLRLYPPVGFVERVCETTYELPPSLPGEKPFVMKKGMIFWIPIFALHRDEKYYDQPDKFRPERFLDKAQHDFYMPFGAGPRMCIGNRFALVEIKVLLFHLLARCELKPCAKTTLPIRFSKSGLRIHAENGFWLNVRRRSDSVIKSSLNDAADK
jgi:cytochrome P450 family 9